MLFGTSRQMKDNEILRYLHSLKNDPSAQTSMNMNVDLVSLTDKHLYFWHLTENDIQVKSCVSRDRERDIERFFLACLFLGFARHLCDGSRKKPSRLLIV